MAPGWLDSDARMLEPERKSEPGHRDTAASRASAGAAEGSAAAGSAPWVAGHGPGGEMEMAVPDVGDQLDRAFGTMTLQGSRPG